MTCTATDHITSDMKGGDELIAARRGVRPARAASGRGLAIVHRLVDANRGEIRFDTSASGGLLTEIGYRLPRRRRPSRLTADERASTPT